MWIRGSRWSYFQSGNRGCLAIVGLFRMGHGYNYIMMRPINAGSKLSVIPLCIYCLCRWNPPSLEIQRQLVIRAGRLGSYIILTQTSSLDKYPQHLWTTYEKREAARVFCDFPFNFHILTLFSLIMYQDKHGHHHCLLVLGVVKTHQMILINQTGVYHL